MTPSQEIRKILIEALKALPGSALLWCGDEFKVYWEAAPTDVAMPYITICAMYDQPESFRSNIYKNLWKVAGHTLSQGEADALLSLIYSLDKTTPSDMLYGCLVCTQEWVDSRSVQNHREYSVGYYVEIPLGLNHG